MSASIFGTGQEYSDLEQTCLLINQNQIAIKESLTLTYANLKATVSYVEKNQCEVIKEYPKTQIICRGHASRLEVDLNEIYRLQILAAKKIISNYNLSKNWDSFILRFNLTWTRLLILVDQLIRCENQLCLKFKAQKNLQAKLYEAINADEPFFMKSKLKILEFKITLLTSIPKDLEQNITTLNKLSADWNQALLAQGATLETINGFWTRASQSLLEFQNNFSVKPSVTIEKNQIIKIPNPLQTPTKLPHIPSLKISNLSPHPYLGTPREQSIKPGSSSARSRTGSTPLQSRK